MAEDGVVQASGKALAAAALERAKAAGMGDGLFARLVADGLPPSMLTTQFRMHPAISAYPSRAFYRGRLRDGVNGHDRPPPSGFAWPQTTAHGITPFVFLNVESSEQRESVFAFRRDGTVSESGR